MEKLSDWESHQSLGKFVGSKSSLPTCKSNTSELPKVDASTLRIEDSPNQDAFLT